MAQESDRFVTSMQQPAKEEPARSNPDLHDGPGWGWQATLRPIVSRFSSRKPWAPMVAAVLAFVASMITSTLVRHALTTVAIILFLFVAADVARAMLEPDPGPCDPRHPVKKVRVTVFQVVMAGVLTVIYTFLIFGALQPLISSLTQPSLWTMAFTVPVVLLVSGLVAWRNMRLWSYEAAEYEDLLTEQKNELAEIERLKKMRLPNSN